MSTGISKQLCTLLPIIQVGNISEEKKFDKTKVTKKRQIGDALRNKRFVSNDWRKKSLEDFQCLVSRHSSYQVTTHIKRHLISNRKGDNSFQATTHINCENATTHINIGLEHKQYLIK